MGNETGLSSVRRFTLISASLFVCVTLCLGLFISSSASAKVKKPKADEIEAAPVLPPFTGPKKRVSVSDLEIKVTIGTTIQPTTGGGLTSMTSVNIPPPSDFGTGMTEMLTTSLIDSGRFIVLERKALSEIQTEISLGASGTVDTESAAQTGKLLGAQALIKGAITEYSYNSSSSGGSASILQGVGLASAKSAATVVIDIRICDINTGQVLDSVKATGKAKSSASAIDIDKENYKMSAASFKQTPLGQATRQAIDKAVVLICARMLKFPWEGMIADIEADDQGKIATVYINAGSNTGLKESDMLQVLRPGRSITDPQTKVVIGRTKDTILGVCRIESTDKDLSIAKVVEGTDFKIGDIVHLLNQDTKPANAPASAPANPAPAPTPKSEGE